MLLDWFFLASETTPADVITGGAGWVGTTLLGSVLMWLFFRHLPDKDKQLKEFNDAANQRHRESIDAKDRQINVIVDAHSARIKEIIEAHNGLVDRLVQRVEQADKERRCDFQATLNVVVDHCQREATMQRDMMSRDWAENVEALKDLRLTMEDLRKVFLNHNNLNP